MRTEKKSEVVGQMVANTINFALACGIPMESISEATGIKRIELIDSETRFPAVALKQIWELHENSSNSVSAGLRMAIASSPEILGASRHVLRFAPNLGEALRSFVCYRSVLADRLELKLKVSKSAANLDSFHPLENEEPGNVNEVGLGVLVSMLRNCVNGEHLIGVDFVHEPLGELKAYDTFFGVPVRFGQTKNSLHFRPEAMQLQMLESDKELFEYVKHNLDILLDRWQLPGDRNLMSRILGAIRSSAEAGEFSTQKLASRMGEGMRKLQRTAREYGYTLRGLIQESREVQARHLLTKSDLDMETIASRLGYTDARSFRRAFFRWVGQTPTEYRKSSQ